ncbi:hypothetical protein [Streptomyces pinistramenti]|uniref:hypothetical protein n=1 Tax=Streptomyces pinistramenti TaxID=2884812 RepID=UPI001D083AAC|nr:hypothetical protein [Streptomyces pinistramenti]MCB5906936.1 hypothetical protein [Streptomyces pinistramenti]
MRTTRLPFTAPSPTGWSGLLTELDLPLRTRVAGVTVLLHAPPLSRVVHPTLDDIGHSEEESFLRLGKPPAPVPSPLARLPPRRATDAP